MILKQKIGKLFLQIRLNQNLEKLLLIDHQKNRIRILPFKNQNYKISILQIPP